MGCTCELCPLCILLCSVIFYSVICSQCVALQNLFKKAVAVFQENSEGQRG